MKKIVSAMALALSAATVCAAARPGHVPAQKSAETSLALFVDAATWEHCSEAISSYREVLGSEGLGVHIYHADWESPEQIKDIILKLADNGRQPLEGAVFVGDIPMVRIGGAQHLTTAFKMNEDVYDRTESWVVSDRFYDDFDLDFSFVDSDTSGFYYRLTEKGSQRVEPDIYSARMLVPRSMDDRYGRLNRYLEEVVRAHSEENPLDNVFFYAGSGYNSDCLTIWRQKPLAWREYFPEAFRKSSTNKFLNYRYGRDIMFRLFQEMQHSGYDLMELSEHGAADTQYITSAGGSDNLREDLTRIRSVLRQYYSRYRGTEDEQPFLEEAENDYGTGLRFFADSFYVRDAVRDSLEDALDNLRLDRIADLRTGPRVLVLNACYNGSFYEEGYVAGHHLFNGGKCVVVQGNTVNVLQDKYEDELMGVLAAGVRIGAWQKGLPYLESHLVGDPTFRFSSPDCEFASRYEALEPDLQYWLRELDSPESLHRAAALKKLHELRVDGMPGLLLRTFDRDASWQVRLEALHLLSFYPGPECTLAVLKALDDPYERISRMAARMAMFIGDPVLRAPLQKIADEAADRQRVQFLASDALQIMDSRDPSNLSCLDGLKSESDETKISSIRFMRNYNLHFAVPELLSMLSDESLSTKVKICMAEALGWFRLSVNRDMIVDYISSMDMSALDPDYAAELNKTLKRLK